MGGVTISVERIKEKKIIIYAMPMQDKVSIDFAGKHKICLFAFVFDFVFVYNI